METPSPFIKKVRNPVSEILQPKQKTQLLVLLFSTATGPAYPEILFLWARGR